MARLLSDVIPFMQCSHEFSWPRRLPNGEYYQVCLRCGAEYGYDWATMRRTERVNHGSEAKTRSMPRQRSGWKPRARRLAVDLGVRYREVGTTQWSQGRIRNVSRTGVLFRAETNLEARAQLEMIFIMPEEISGQTGSRVLCTGSVARTIPVEESENLRDVAVVINDYEFLHERKVPRSAEARA